MIKPFNIIFLCLWTATAFATEPACVDYVDTKIGVIDSRNCNCVIGPMLPYGSINPSPQTENGYMDGYHPDYPIQGFGQLHVSGTGWGSYGHFLISPQTGALNTAALGHGSTHSGDVTKPYFYKTYLNRYRTGVEIAPAHYSAIYRFTFPQAGDSHILFDASQSIASDIVEKMGGKVLENSTSIDPVSGKVRMTLKYNGGWPGGAYYLYFAGQYDKPAKETGVWKGKKKYAGKYEIVNNDINDDEHIGAFARFDTRKGEQVLLKVAISFTSSDKAEDLLNEEIPGWDFDKVAQQGRRAWEEKLSRIMVQTPSAEKKTIFYTSLFRFYTLARDRSKDVNKWNSGMPYWDDNYAYWDTYRTAYPLLSLLDQDAARDNINALIDRFNHNGRIYDGFVAGIDRKDEQGGNDVDHVIVDAYLKGVKGVDWNEAYRIIKFNADSMRTGQRVHQDADKLYMQYRQKGWIPYRVMSTSQSLEYSYNDYSAALMAKALGHKSDYKKYEARSHQWENLWNPDLESRGFTGFIDARNEDGTFANIDPDTYGGSWKSPFYEGEGWTYSYYMPHDFDRLIALMGGKEKFVERLNYGFKNGLIRYINEPGFLTTRAFTHAGRPDLSSYWVHDIMRRGYDLTGYPENDDTGSMASWYVFCAMGFFPNAGQDFYYLNAPVINRSEIMLDNGKKLVITANADEKNIYIKSCRLNGKKWDKPIIRHKDIASGGTLEMELSDVPTDWGQN